MDDFKPGDWVFPNDDCASCKEDAAGGAICVGVVTHGFIRYVRRSTVTLAKIPVEHVRRATPKEIEQARG